jgi:tetratricopeptide (TPR) repeat protein
MERNKTGSGNRKTKSNCSLFALLGLIVSANLTGCSSGAPILVTDPTEQPIKDGNDLLKDGKYLDAAEKFSLVIELKPKLAEGYTKRGIAEAALRQNDKALSDLNKSIDLDATDGEAFYTRGMVYYEKGETKKTYEDLQKAAGIYLKQGKKDECDKVVKKLDELSGVPHPQ